MRRDHLSNMVGGWFVGNFVPSVMHTSDFEVCVKYYQAGDCEPQHYQLSATEITCIVSGEARMGAELLGPGDIIVLDPFDAVPFEAITDVALVAIKTPSVANDKVLGAPESSAQ